MDKKDSDLIWEAWNASTVPGRPGAPGQSLSNVHQATGGQIGSGSSHAANAQLPVDNASVIPGIKCNATDCIHNRDGVSCAAPGEVEILRGAASLLEALCMTFERKQDER